MPRRQDYVRRAPFRARAGQAVGDLGQGVPLLVPRTHISRTMSSPEKEKGTSLRAGKKRKGRTRLDGRVGVRNPEVDG